MWQSPAAMIETPEIATPVCALVRNDKKCEIEENKKYGTLQ